MRPAQLPERLSLNDRLNYLVKTSDHGKKVNKSFNQTKFIFVDIGSAPFNCIADDGADHARHFAKVARLI